MLWPTAQLFLQNVVADVPLSVWFVPPFILFALAGVSLVDARTGRVPDLPVLAAFLLAFFALAFWGNWQLAGERLLYAVGALFALRLANRAYCWLAGHEALGFGDAKWTALAVLGFNYKLVAIAWALAAWLALLWIGLRKLWLHVAPRYEGQIYVHFAPFLFAGLLIALAVFPSGP